jgi:hypothetical protein
MTELATETRVSTAGFDPEAGGVTPPSNPDRRGAFLADVVVELGLADQETIDRAQQAAQETERSLDRYLLESGILDEDSISRAIAERNGLDHVDLEEFAVDTDAARMVTRSAARRYSAVPVAFASDGALIVAVQDPFDTLGISDIEVMTRSSVRPAIATASGIEALIEDLPEQPVSRPIVPEPAAIRENGAVEEPEAEEPAAELSAEEKPAAEAAPTELVREETPVEETISAEPVVELGPSFDPGPVLEIGEEAESAPEIFSMREIQAEPEAEPSVEPEPAVEPGVVLLPEPELADEAPEPDVVLELKPELVRFPDVELGSGPDTDSDDARLDLEDELGSLQESARRADELAARVEGRIAELEGAGSQAGRLEADLEAALRRVEQLERQLSGVDTLAEELRATTAKLEDVNRVLEGSVR